MRGSPTVSVTAGVSGARRALGLRTAKPVKTTVSIVKPNAPKNVNATMRCARVGFGRAAARSRCGDSAVAGVRSDRSAGSSRSSVSQGRFGYHSSRDEPTPGGHGLKWRYLERRA